MLLYTHNYAQTYMPKNLQLQRTYTNTLTNAKGKRAEEVKKDEADQQTKGNETKSPKT